MLDFLCYWIGVVVLSVGGLSLASLLVAFGMDYIWRVYRRAIGLEELISAVKEYRAKKEAV